MNADPRPSDTPSARPPHRVSFGRSQASSVVATSLDFAIFFAALRLGVAPVPATVVGAVCGAVVNFFGGRVWAFQATDGALPGQAGRYAVMAASSVAANAAVLYLLFTFGGLPAGVARVAAACLVAALHNYPLQRAWVFRQR